MSSLALAQKIIATLDTSYDDSVRQIETLVADAPYGEAAKEALLASNEALLVLLRASAVYKEKQFLLTLADPRARLWGDKTPLEDDALGTPEQVDTLRDHIDELFQHLLVHLLDIGKAQAIAVAKPLEGVGHGH